MYMFIYYGLIYKCVTVYSTKFLQFFVSQMKLYGKLSTIISSMAPVLHTLLRFSMLSGILYFRQPSAHFVNIYEQLDICELLCNMFSYFEPLHNNFLRLYMLTVVLPIVRTYVIFFWKMYEHVALYRSEILVILSYMLNWNSLNLFTISMGSCQHWFTLNQIIFSHASDIKFFHSKLDTNHSLFSILANLNSMLQ